MVAQLDAFARRFMHGAQAPRVSDVPLSRQEFRVLAVLGDGEARTMGDLAERVLTAVSSVTGIVDRLVAKRLAERERCEKDRRVVWVRLTAQGRRLRAEFRRHRLHMARVMLGSLNECEQDEFLALIRKIGGTAGKGGPQGREGMRPR